MKYVMILFILGVCYVSLPMTTEMAAVGQSKADTVAPAKAEPTKSADKSEAKPAEPAAEDAKADPADAKAAATDKDESQAAAPKEDSESGKKTEEKKADIKKKRKTAKVETKRMRVVVTLDGTFAAEKMSPVALRPDVWTQFEIVEIVPHGAEVHEGQVLVKFDAEKIDEEIADLELELHQSELAIRKAEAELPRLEKTLATAASDAARLKKEAREDYDRYYSIDRPMILKSVDYTLKGAKFQLDYQQDELDQLEKMYEADDLTEATEEIVLKRSRTSVDFAKFNLEQTVQYCDELRQIRLPRYETAIKDLLDKAEIELGRAQTALGVDLIRARYDLQQQRQMRTKSLDRLGKLMTDRSLMELKAPADGIVYYGECEDGDWSDIATLITKFKPHANVPAESVVMTIVERRPLEVLAQVGEDKRADFSVGQQAKVVPPLENAAWLPAKLAVLTSVPVATGKYNADFELTGGELPDWIVAGMGCKVKVTTYDQEAVLVVPKKAVQTDKLDEEKKFLWFIDAKDIAAKDGDPKDASIKAVRRNVKLGKTSGDDVEVLSGVKQGDVISLDDETKSSEDKDGDSQQDEDEAAAE